MIYTLIFSLLSLFIFCGCQSDISEQTIETIKSKALDVTKEVEPIANQVYSATTDHTNKIFKYEYKTISVDMNSNQLETTLNQLGADRWDCFAVVPNNDKLNVICKRLPYGVLRHFLRF
jgi:hypothetical protein